MLHVEVLAQVLRMGQVLCLSGGLRVGYMVWKWVVWHELHVLHVLYMLPLSFLLYAEHTV